MQTGTSDKQEAREEEEEEEAKEQSLAIETTTTTTTTTQCSAPLRERQQRQVGSIYSFPQARRMARSYGFVNAQEYMEYDCPGAYALPKHPQEIWSLEWQGWDDFLGTCPAWLTARHLARALQLKPPSADAYLEWFHNVKSKNIPDDDPTSRLPYRPDLVYNNDGWINWVIMVGCS